MIRLKLGDGSKTDNMLDIEGVTDYSFSGINRTRDGEMRHATGAPNMEVQFALDKAAGGHKVFANWFKEGGEGVELARKVEWECFTPTAANNRESHWILHRAVILAYSEYSSSVAAGGTPSPLMHPYNRQPLSGSGAVIVLRGLLEERKVKYLTSSDMATFE